MEIWVRRDIKDQHSNCQIKSILHNREYNHFAIMIYASTIEYICEIFSTKQNLRLTTPWVESSQYTKFVSW